MLFRHSIGLRESDIGVISAALTFSIALGALVGGRLGDRFGRRSVFLVTMVMIAVGAVLLTFGAGFVPLLAGSILVGLGSGADLPVSLATVSEAATDVNRGKLVSLTQIMWNGGVIATTVISVVGNSGRLGGQILFGHVLVAAVVVFGLRLTIPESESWKAAVRERRTGSIRDIFAQRNYLIPFLALLGFYSLTNLGANTSGQFGAYVAVNVAHIDVPTYSLIGLVGLPVATLFAVWFLRISDGPHRMTYFIAGGVFMSVGYLVPAVFGFSLATIVIAQATSLVGFAFAFEGIMKIWTQESFPTLLRSSAQGAIIAVARVAAGALALLTPSLLTAPRLMYALIAAVLAIGCFCGWLGFRGRRVSTFDVATDEVRSAPSPVQ